MVLVYVQKSHRSKPRDKGWFTGDYVVVKIVFS